MSGDERKQRELAHVVRVLFEEFEAAHAIGTKLHKKQGRIAKLVLYGSYARGDWVHDPVGGYARWQARADREVA